MKGIPTIEEVEEFLLVESNRYRLEEVIAQYRCAVKTSGMQPWDVPCTIEECRAQFTQHVRPFVDTLLRTSTDDPKIVGPIHLGFRSGLAGSAIAYTAVYCKHAIDNAMSRRAFLSDTFAAIIMGTISRFCIESIPDSYDQFSGNIIVDAQPLHTMVGVLAHEYAHHVLYQHRISGKFIWNNNRTFDEGFVRGVQRQFVRAYARDIDYAPEDDYYYRYLDELHQVHRWIADNTGAAPLAPHPELSIERRVFGKHALGHALFAIAEAKHGPGIYAEALKNPRVVLE